jgi:hypothetical protein
MSKKMILICIKYFLEKISSLNHHIMKGKSKNIYIYPPPFFNRPIPHHQNNNSLGKKKLWPSYLEKQTNSPSHAPPKKLLEKSHFFFYYLSNYKRINGLRSNILDNNLKSSLNCIAKEDKECNLKFHHHVIIV